MNINKLRNKAINATVSVLAKAKAPEAVDALYTKALNLNDHDLNVLFANIGTELDRRRPNKTCYQCEAKVPYLFNDARCINCTNALEGDEDA